MFTDIHHHIIYGLDDGAQSFEMTQRMLQRAKKDRISRIIATPHVMPGHQPFDWESYGARLNEINQWCRETELGISVYPGAEILYTVDTARMAEKNELPTMLPGSRTLLVEFIPNEDYKMLLEAARKLGNLGYSVIFAHIERYACLRRKGRIEELRNEYYVRMQMNAATIAEKQGFFEDRWIDSVLKNEWIDYVSTDAHNLTTRRCMMSKCYLTLKERYGEDLARWLCGEHAEELFEQAAIMNRAQNP